MTRLLFASVEASLRHRSGMVEAFDALFIPIPDHAEAHVALSRALIESAGPPVLISTEPVHDATSNAAVKAAGLSSPKGPAVVASQVRA